MHRLVTIRPYRQSDGDKTDATLLHKRDRTNYSRIKPVDELGFYSLIHTIGEKRFYCTKGCSGDKVFRQRIAIIGNMT